MRKILGVIAVIFAVALAGVAMSPAVLYLYGLRQIPDEVLAAPPQILPAAATAALWAHLGGTGAPRIERSNPYTLIWLFLKGGPLAASPEDQVAGLGSRALLRRVPDFPRDRRLIVSVSAGIWVGWHWTAEQALSAHLTESYFGHRFYGLEAAAQGYFGLPSAQLSLEQMAHLVIVPRSPSRLDPWCNPEGNQAAARQAMSRLPQARPDAPIHLLAVPAGTCPSELP